MPLAKLGRCLNATPKLVQQGIKCEKEGKEC